MSAVFTLTVLQNSEAEMAKINLREKDIEPLVAFLKSLNEDYD